MMIRALRTDIATRLAEASFKLQNTPDGYNPLSWQDQIQRLTWCIRFRPVTKRSDVSGAQLQVPFSLLRACSLVNSPTHRIDSRPLVEALSEKFLADSTVQNLSTGKEGLNVKVDTQQLLQSVLTDITAAGAAYGRNSDIYCLEPSIDGSRVEEHRTGQNIVVEYSSPNIAKPFHAGHLRSTILGQFVASICRWFGQNVVRINYLGDWGTQFGLLGVGFQKYGNMDALKSSPIQHLFEVYVKINKDAETDETVHATGMAYFNRMEHGDKQAVSFWRLCRQLSIEEYTTMYNRLGVSFTHTHGESMYHKAARQLVEDLDTKGLLQRNSKTGVGFLDLTEPTDKVPVHANLVKSDGSTLYLTRDIVAAIDRLDSLHADKLLYVVENGQHQHFQQLRRALIQLDHHGQTTGGIGDHLDTKELFHIKFGRVEGMSTRRGDVVFLRDILDEAKSRMFDTMKTKTTTKVLSPEEVGSVAEALGVAAVLVQDMKEYRLNNYRFSWDRIINFTGDTGVFLQYTHARLHSLISKSQDELQDVEPDFGCLQEDSAHRLVQHLARFDEVLLKSYTDFEPCHVVHYLFNIGRLVNVAHDELYVKGQPEQIAKARLVLFQAAKTVVSTGLSILGITALDRL